jgi:GNAT superfamily N-acetyltransferase
MTPATETIERFDPMQAGETEFAALLAFTNAMRAELMPDDPPTPLAEAIAAWRSLPDMVHQSTWTVRQGEGGSIVARGQVTYADTEENRHVARGAIQVLAAQRRQGLGCQLLARIAGAMRDARRTLLIAETSGRVAGGAAFMERLGAERGLETHTHQLKIAGLDRDLIRRWQARAAERAAGFELGFWDGPYPEADIVAVADLYQVMNTQPLGSLAIEHQRFTPPQLRQIEAALLARGARRWTIVVRERATGRFAGFTETFWRPSVPEVLSQGNTGVFPELRGRGLGRWLKAAMLDRVLRERPEVRFVRTANADSNQAMLDINRELGFESYVSRTVWQVGVDKIERYLSSLRA